MVPKKMSQLMSALHFLLSSKAIKACLKDNWKGVLVARGVLIQKAYGCYHCEAQVNLETG